MKNSSCGPEQNEIALSRWSEIFKAFIKRLNPPARYLVGFVSVLGLHVVCHEEVVVGSLKALTAVVR